MTHLEDLRYPWLAHLCAFGFRVEANCLQVRLLKKRIQRDPTTQQIAVTAVDNFQDRRSILQYILCSELPNSRSREISGGHHILSIACRSQRVKRTTSLSYHWSVPIGALWCRFCMLFVFHMLGLGQGISQQMDHDRPIDFSSAMDDYIV